MESVGAGKRVEAVWRRETGELSRQLGEYQRKETETWSHVAFVTASPSC